MNGYVLALWHIGSLSSVYPDLTTELDKQKKGVWMVGFNRIKFYRIL